MTINQKRKIKSLEEALSVVNRQERLNRNEVIRLKKLLKIPKKCKYCGHSPTKLPESKKAKNVRVMKGINKLKKKGILQWSSQSWEIMYNGI